ncbi:MAG: sigma-70 family RNA polymerase sigma factor [Lachnospiraceae bacterium]|nr:sigma-70 family RNA polymerase sigma factor [Lachnospiraceae bacterium]
MIIKYNFLSKLSGDMPDVEVDDDLGKKMEQMALDEYNLDRAETRRHTYMSQLEENGHYIVDDRDPLDDILEAELHEALMAAIEKLQPQQKELLIRVYWNKELQKDIAAEEGVSEMAISSRMKRIFKKLKKFLE